MKRLFLHTWYIMAAYILSAVCFLTGCTADDTLENLQKPVSSPLVIETSKVGFGADSTATRATVSLTDAAFEAGDEIGVFAVDRNGLVTVANIPFTLSATGWSTSENITYAPDYTYYAYYPYKSSLTGAPAVGTTITTPTADGFFSSVISSWTPLADQSSKANFNSSDLMVAKGQHTSSKSISFSMSHKMGLAIINITNRYYIIDNPSDYWYMPPTFSGNIPYNNRGNNLFLVRPDVNTSVSETIANISSGSSKEYSIYNNTAAYSYNGYLRFTVIEEGTFSFTKNGLSYSLDNGVTWTALAANANTPTVAAGKNIMWKNNTPLTPETSLYEGIGDFSSSTAAYDASGNIMSLLFGDDFEGQTDLTDKPCAFYLLFRWTKIRNAINLILPATTLSRECYAYMFNGCSSLITTPVLPATSLTNRCYASMFQGCSSLTTAPELPATTLESGCYSNMFYICTSLTTAPELPATTLANNCYAYMFEGCTALTTAPELPATTLAAGCYCGMFRRCTGLTTAPELPATTLENNCYSYMFYNCSSLNYIKTAFTTTPSTTYTNSWVNGVAATGTFYKNSAASWNVTGVNGIPSGWTIQTYTP